MKQDGADLVAKALVASAGRSTSSADQTLIASSGRSTAIELINDPFIVRRLTPRECERLSGWPDDHTRFTADGREIADLHRYRMTGNAVVSPVAEWLGRRLVAVDAAL